MIDISRPNLVLVATVATWTASASQKKCSSHMHLYSLASIYPPFWVGPDRTDCVVMFKQVLPESNLCFAWCQFAFFFENNGF
jgi:hypothetical protein